MLQKEMKLSRDSFVDINIHVVYTMYIQKESEAKNLCMYKLKNGVTVRE